MVVIFQPSIHGIRPLLDNKRRCHQCFQLECEANELTLDFSRFQMDVGVGSFVVANGVVSREARNLPM
jgi:hypothetical protein